MATQKQTPEQKNTIANQDRGAATSFSGKYNVNSTSYPNDLFSNANEYGGNYVIFYINVQDDSKFLSKEPGTTITDEIPPRLRGDLVGSNIGKVEGTVAAGTATAVPTGAVSGVTRMFGGQQALSTTDPKTGVVTRGALKSAGMDALKAGGTTALAGGVVAMNASSMSRQQKRLSKAIALHVPNQLNIRYSMQWQDEETFAYQAAAIGARALHNDATPENWKGMGAAAAIATNLALSKTPVVAGALSAASGMAPNPKKEQVFKNVNFREFSFDYQFSPRSSDEARQVREIIQTFKFHMHPEYKDYNNFVFLYPSEFDIFYYQNGKENLNLHRHTSCVLKDMSVNYTPNGMFNTFEDGMPTQINVTLNFVELAILTKQNIQDKF
jgi:hypothetical protein